MLQSKIKLNIRGNNVERFIKRLKNNNIELISINYRTNKEIDIKIYKKDYESVLNLKTIYEVDVVNYYGFTRFKNNILNNKFIIICILISLIFLYVLSNIIFNIEVVTNDSKMKNILLEELDSYGIKKYNFKKNYTNLQKIKKEIITKYRNQIEWLEIDCIGTKYIVRYEPRVLNNQIISPELRNIVAKKDAVINSIFVSNGEIIKDVNTYVKKGDVIVSGYIKLNDSIKDTVSSKGKIYGEVWYKVTVTYPYKYYESVLTGREKTVFSISFINKKIELFNFNKYKTKEIEKIVLLKNNLLPITINKEIQKETKVINENNTTNQVIKKAVSYAKNKINVKLKENEYIKDYKILNKVLNKDSVTLNIFFTVIEDITEYQEIEKYEEIIQ